MSEPRGFLKVSLKGWTLKVTIDLKKCVGRLLRGGVDKRLGKKRKSTMPRKPRAPKSGYAVTAVDPAPPKKQMTASDLVKAAKTVTVPPAPQ